jgi:hypothetical protein
MNAREWSSRIAELARRENSALADLLLAVGEFDGQEVYRQLEFSSLFDFLHREIGLSRGSAYYRQVGARMVRRFPEVEEPIRDGRLCITTVSELSKVMIEENRTDVLPRFFGLSRQEAKQLVAELRPVDLVPRRPIVTEIPLLAPMGSAPTIVQPVGRDRTHLDRGMPLPLQARTVVDPMTSTETRMHLTVSREFVALLRKAKAGQSHVQPNATDEQVLTAALELLVENQEKRKASVPAKVKREVRKRDQGKCQWKLADGGVCGSEVRLEIDHVQPRGRGGPSTTENCRLLCKAHNLEAARLAYGDHHMDLFTRRVPAARESEAQWGYGNMASSLPLPGPRQTLRGDAFSKGNEDRHDRPDLKNDRIQRVEVTRLGARLRGQRPRHRTGPATLGTAKPRAADACSASQVGHSMTRRSTDAPSGRSRICTATDAR